MEPRQDSKLFLPDPTSLLTYARAWWTDAWADAYIEIRPIAHDRTEPAQKAALRARRYFAWDSPEVLSEHIAAHIGAHAKHAVEWSWYAGAAPRTTKAGTAESVPSLSGAWVDLDDHDGQATQAAQSAEVLAALEQMGFPPTLAVRSGGGRGRHLYYRYRELCDAEEGVALNRLLATVLHGDLQATDRARVLRVPGTWHTKRTPVLSTVETAEASREYSVSDFSEALELLAERYGRKRVQVRRVLQRPSSSDDAWTPLEKKDAARIVDVCARFRQFADPSHQVRLSEPEWGHLGSNLKAVLPDDVSLWLEWSQIDGARPGASFDERTAIEYYERHYSAPVHCHVMEETTPKAECRACPFFHENRTPAFLLRRMLGGGRVLGAPSHVDALRRLSGESGILSSEAVEGDVEERVRLAAQYERSALNEFLAQLIDEGRDETAAALGLVVRATDEATERPEQASETPVEIADSDAIHSAIEALRGGTAAQQALQGALGALARLQAQSELEFHQACRDLVEAGKAQKLSMGLLKRSVKQASDQLLGGQAAPSLPRGGASDGDATTTAPRPILIAETMPEAPLAYLAVPSGYGLSHDGMSRFKSMVGGYEIEEFFSLAPCYITKIYRDVTSDHESWEIAYLRRGIWRSQIVDREVGQNSRKIVELSGCGIPVHSDNASDLVKFLAAFESTNLENLPVEQVTSHMGWQDRAGFVYGKEYIPLEDEQTIQFRPLGGGDEQLAQAIRAHGNLQAWMDAITPAVQYPVVRLAFYAAFAPPLLDILNCPNFILDFSGKTSRGKTSLLRVAASVFGAPDRERAASVMNTWNNTPVGLERLCSASTHLPVILDDTKDAPNPTLVAKLIYLIAGGKGKTRGQLKGAATTAAWRTVLFSSGEQPAVSYTRDGGTRGRTVTVTKLPFGEPSKETEALLECLSTDLSDHHGHGLPLFVRFIAAHKDEWMEWRKTVDGTRRRYAEQTKEETGKRLARYMATVHVTADLVHRAFAEAGQPLPFDVRYPTSELWSDILGESRDPRGEEEALRAVASWAAANQQSFWGRHTHGDSDSDVTRQPNQGWLGRWDREAWTYLAVEVNALKRFLEQSGFAPEEVLDGWYERGWTTTTGGKKNRRTKQVRVNGEPVYCVALTRQTMDRLRDGTLDDEEDETPVAMASVGTDDPFA
ncbi:MAG: DUF927 domain-containing protein [Alicyclobacillaceae bacterium]|nr:DUF927 domain-containing protein [Alicyclobacillaceae bacterium]